MKIFQTTNAIATIASASQTLIRTKERSDALAAADASRGDSVAPAAPAQLVQRGNREPRSGGSERVPEGDRAAVRVKFLSSGVHLAQTGQHLRGKRLVDLEYGEIAHRDAAFFKCFGNRKGRADAHDRRIPSDHARRNKTAEPRHAVGFRALARGQNDRRGAIGNAAGIAGRDDSVFYETRRQFRELFHRQTGSRPFVLFDAYRRASRARYVDRYDLLRKIAIALRA